MMPLQISIIEDDGRLHIKLGDATIPLQPGRAESTISNILLEMRVGIDLTLISTHIQSHSTPEPSCPCCKLEGKVLSAQGRKPVTQRPTYTSSSGTVQVRHISPSKTGAQIAALYSRFTRREAIAAHRALGLKPAPQKSTKKRIEDLI